jgi:hypothetical protein
LDLIEQKPVIPPLQRHLQLETDFFCHQCGYNLHGQIVTRDERLDMLVCRCPECGRFHPAGLGVSATRPWLARAGVGLIVGWVMFVLIFLALGGFFLGVLGFAHMNVYTVRDYPEDMSNVNYNDIPRIPLSEWKPRGNQSPYAYRYDPGNTPWITMVSISVVIAVVLGVFCAGTMWHVSPSRLYLVLALPILAALVTYLLWWGNENIDRIVGWSILRLGAYALAGVIAMAVGLVIGRPVLRFLLRWIVSPKLRQHVHFLWTCDGKTPPSIRSRADGVLA